jgi:hypothetical protein
MNVDHMRTTNIASPLNFRVYLQADFFTVLLLTSLDAALYTKCSSSQLHMQIQVLVSYVPSAW